MDDQELINAIVNYQNGIDVEENFNFIYQRTIYYVEGKVRGYFGNRKASTYDIEDVVQDVFLGVVRNIGKLEEPRAFFSWLNKISFNKVNDFFDTRQGQTVVVETSSDVKLDDEGDKPLTHDIEDLRVKSNPELSAFQTNTVMVVREIIDSLTDAQKDALIPSYLYQLSDQEIADQLGINLNTYKSRKKSAMDALARKKAEFKKRGVEIAVIPFVLLLRVAYRSDEALAASLTAGMAASGITKAVQAAATGAANATTGASGVSASTVNVAGTSGTAKAAGAGIAVKAAATVAAVAVVAGGTYAHKTSNRSAEPVTETIAVPTGASIETTESSEATSEEVLDTPGVYASSYGAAVEDYAATYGLSTDDVAILLADLDGNGTIEMSVYTKKSRDDHSPTNDSIYTISNDGIAVLLIHSLWIECYNSGNGEAYIWTGDKNNHIQELYTLSGTSLNLVRSAPMAGDLGVISEEEEEMYDFMSSFGDGVDMAVFTYDELITSSDDYIMHRAIE